MTPSEMKAQADLRRKELTESFKKAAANPPKVDPTVQQQLYSEVVRANAPRPGRAYVEGRGGMVINEQGKETREGAPNAENQGKDKTRQTREDAQGDARVQARGPEVKLRPEGEVQEAGDSNRPVGKWTEQRQAVKEADASPRGEEVEEVWVSRHYEAETKEALSEIIPADAKAVTYKKIWQASALVRKV